MPKGQVYHVPLSGPELYKRFVGGSTVLTWAPPTLVTPTTVTVPVGGQLELKNDTDYIINARAAKTTEPIRIRGGRNIHLIGAHIEISGIDAPSEIASVGVNIEENPFTTSDPVRAGGASVDGRTVHIEGVRIDGTSLSQGIRTDAPTAIIQLQNIYVGTVRFKNSDHRDGTNNLPINHPDIIQTYGSQKELRIDRFTGSSAYQGLFFKEDHTDRVMGPMRLRRVNVKAVEVAGVEQDGAAGFSYAGMRMITKANASSGLLHLDPGTVWVQSHPNNGWAGGSFKRVRYWDTATLAYVSDPVLGTGVFTDALHDDSSVATTGTDGIGTFATLGTEIVNWSGTAAGRVYSGVPSNGDYVTANSVGMGYVSPGYA